MDIYLIRHTKVKVDNGICYGQSDVDVADTFENEVKKLKEKCHFSPKMVFYTSPLKRCLLLAEKLSSTPPIIDDRLLEISFGDWELKKWDLIDRSELEEWTNNFIMTKIPNGESYFDLYKRSCKFFDDLVKKDHKNVVIISHSGVIRSIITYILKIPLEKSFIIQIDYGKMSKIKYNFVNNSDPILNIEFLNQ